MQKALIVSALMAACLATAQAYSLFDFEEFTSTNETGGYTSVSSTKGGLTLDIYRSSGTAFDITDTTFGGTSNPFPLTWDAKCLDPFFAPTTNDYFVGNFSSAVSAVELEMTDFAQDSDMMEMFVFSGSDGSGTLLATVTHFWDMDSSPNWAGLGWNGVANGESAMSIVFRGGSEEFPNSMFVDNIAATPVPEPATLLALGLGAVVLLRRRAK